MISTNKLQPSFLILPLTFEFQKMATKEKIVTQTYDYKVTIKIERLLAKK